MMMHDVILLQPPECLRSAFSCAHKVSCCFNLSGILVLINLNKKSADEMNSGRL